MTHGRIPLAATRANIGANDDDSPRVVARLARDEPAPPCARIPPSSTGAPSRPGDHPQLDN